MDEDRKHEIAYLFLKTRIEQMTEKYRNKVAFDYLVSVVEKKGLRSLSPAWVNEEICKFMKELDLSRDDAQDFTLAIIFPLVHRAFPTRTMVDEIEWEKNNTKTEIF